MTPPQSRSACQPAPDLCTGERRLLPAMWEYTIDEGPAALGDGDDVDQTLHTFSAYYVPAVELDGIDVLKNK